MRAASRRRQGNDWRASAGNDPRGPGRERSAYPGQRTIGVRHDHPVALLGYIAVFEGRPPSVEFLDWMVETTGVSGSAFRTLYRHAQTDVGHGDVLRALLDRLPLEPRHESLLTRSAFHTVAELGETLLRIVESAPPGRDGDPRVAQ
jgi:hypothetical protein